MTSRYHFYVDNDVVMTSFCHDDVIDDVINCVGTRPSAMRGRSLFFKVKESELLRVQSVVRIKCSVVRIKCRLTDRQKQNVTQFLHPPSPTGIGWNKVVLHNHLDSQLLTPTGIRIRAGRDGPVLGCDCVHSNRAPIGRRIGTQNKVNSKRTLSQVSSKPVIVFHGESRSAQLPNSRAESERDTRHNFARLPLTRRTT